MRLARSRSRGDGDYLPVESPSDRDPICALSLRMDIRKLVLVIKPLLLIKHYNKTSITNTTL